MLAEWGVHFLWEFARESLKQMFDESWRETDVSGMISKYDKIEPISEDKDKLKSWIILITFDFFCSSVR